SEPNQAKLQAALTPSIGVGLSGAVALNQVTDSTQAYINDAANINLQGGPLGLESEDQTGIYALTGAATYVKTTKLAVGIAGSASLNNLDITTEAFVIGATFQQAGPVSLTANRDGGVTAYTAGVPIAAALPGVAPPAGAAFAGSVAVSFSFNTINAATHAYLD